MHQVATIGNHLGNKLSQPLNKNTHQVATFVNPHHLKDMYYPHGLEQQAIQHIPTSAGQAPTHS